VKVSPGEHDHDHEPRSRVTNTVVLRCTSTILPLYFKNSLASHRPIGRLTLVRNNANIKKPVMPKISVVFYQEDTQTVPVLDWLDRLPARAQDKMPRSHRTAAGFGA
jgi:hypothetical protein